MSLDLADLDSVRQAAKTVLESGDAEAVHGLINNAGIMCAPFGKTRQEIESQFGTVGVLLVVTSFLFCHSLLFLSFSSAFACCCGWWNKRSEVLIRRAEPHRPISMDELTPPTNLSCWSQCKDSQCG